MPSSVPAFPGPRVAPATTLLTAPSAASSDLSRAGVDGAEAVANARDTASDALESARSSSAAVTKEAGPLRSVVAGAFETTLRAGVAGALPPRPLGPPLGGDIHGGISPSGEPPFPCVPPSFSSSITEGTFIEVPGRGGSLARGRLTMARTYCARTASRALCAAPTMDLCCALARSARRRAACFSRTCSGVSPEGSAARHIGHVEKSCSRHFTRQHRWNTWLQSVVNKTRFGSANASGSQGAAVVASRGAFVVPSASVATSVVSRASAKKSRRRSRSRSRGEKHTAHISSWPILYPEAGVRGFLRRLDAGAEGVLMGVENTRRREPAAGVREGVAALRGGSTFGVATEVDARGSEASSEADATTASNAISALPKRRCVDAFRRDTAAMTAEDRDKLRSLPRDAGGASFARVNRRASRLLPSPRARPVRARAPIGR